MRNLHDPRIDWFRHNGRFYIVVDPHGAILYLDEPRYIRQSRAWDSNELSWELLAVPSDRQPPSGDNGDTGADQSGPSSNASHGETPQRKPRNQNSPPVPRWRNWVSKLVTSFRKWKNTPAGGFGSNPVKGVPKRKSGNRRLKTIGNLVLPNERNLVRLLNGWQALLSQFTGKPLSALQKRSYSVSNLLLLILKSNGLLYLIKYLKVSYICILKYLSGEILSSTIQLGVHVGLTNGLPVWFPPMWRTWIRRHDLSGIRFILSFLYIYKSFECKVEADLSTIEAQPYTGDTTEFREFCHKTLKSLGVPVLLGSDLQPKGYSSVARGPNGGTISGGIWEDAMGWILREMTQGPSPFGLWVTEVREAVKAQRGSGNHYFNMLSGITSSLEESNIPWDLKVKQGRLATFSDGGGKQRVVALPDWWTQLLLKPVHDHLMKVLSLLPQDATFDQDGKLKEFADRGYGSVYSIDLKAATDMIPQQLYRDCLSYIIGDFYADLWIRLLVDRDYHFSQGRGKESRVLRYTRGQPMGALSSWPAMALVHHMIVLFAAHKAGLEPTLFRDYLVLGDDNVTADPRVAKVYLDVARILGVVISLPKTFTSKTTGLFQFASQVYLNGVNISPISFKQEMNCLRPFDRLNQAWTILTRWYPGEGMSKLIRLMVPRPLWPEISRSLSDGGSHPLIQLIVRTLLIPGTMFTTVAGSSRAALGGFLSTLSGRFNLDRIYTNMRKTDNELGVLSPVEAAILRSVITEICRDCYTVMEDFKSGLDALHSGSEQERRSKRYFHYSEVLSIQDRLNKLTSWFFPSISRIMNSAAFGPASELPGLLSRLLDMVQEGRCLANFSEAVLKPTQQTLNNHRLISRFNLESGLVPRSLWRSLTTFGVQVERISRKGCSQPLKPKHKVSPRQQTREAKTR